MQSEFAKFYEMKITYNVNILIIWKVVHYDISMIYKKSYFEYFSGVFSRRVFKLSFIQASGNIPDLEELESYCPL